MLKIMFVADKGYGYGRFEHDGTICRGFMTVGLLKRGNPRPNIVINGRQFFIYRGTQYIFIFPQKNIFLYMEILAHEIGHWIIYVLFRQSWLAGVFNRWHEKFYHFYLKYLED